MATKWSPSRGSNRPTLTTRISTQWNLHHLVDQDALQASARGSRSLPTGRLVLDVDDLLQHQLDRLISTSLLMISHPSLLTIRQPSLHPDANGGSWSRKRKIPQALVRMVQGLVETAPSLLPLPHSPLTSTSKTGRLHDLHDLR